MPRPYFPHTLLDVTRNVDGPLGLVVGDMPDGSIWVLRRQRKLGGYTLTHWSTPQRTDRLSQQAFDDRHAAVDAMAEAIGLQERLG